MFIELYYIRAGISGFTLNGPYTYYIWIAPEIFLYWEKIVGEIIIQAEK